MRIKTNRDNFLYLRSLSSRTKTRLSLKDHVIPRDGGARVQGQSEEAEAGDDSSVHQNKRSDEQDDLHTEPGLH